MRFLVFAGALLLMVSGAVQAASQRDRPSCFTTDMTHPDEKIASCTRLIDAGELNTPDRAGAYANRAGAYVNKGDNEHALADANEAIRLDPKNVIAYVNRAASYKNRDDDAIADSNEAIRLNPKTALAYINRSAAFLRKGDNDRAFADANEAIRLDSSNDLAFNNRATAYFAKGDNDHAITDYSRAIVLKPKLPQYYGRRADVFLEKADFSHALADYGRAIDLDPKNADYYAGRGFSYLRNNEPDRAIADLSQAVNLGLKSPRNYYNRALSYFLKDDHDRAIADLDEAIKLNPNDAMYYFYRGQNEAAKNEYDGAIVDFTKAIGIDSKNDRFFNGRGMSYNQNGDADRAIVDYTQAIALNGKNDDAYGNRADAYLSKGEYDRASADYGQAIALDPKSALYYRGRARSNLYAGARDKALADVDQASKLAPKSSYAALWTQIIRQRSGLQDNFAQISSPPDTDWPAPVIRLYQGQIGYDALLAAADDKDISNKKGRVCEAIFYTGELELAKGSKSEAIRLFRLASNNCPRSFDEFGAANAELRALGLSPGTSTASRIVNSISGFFGGSTPTKASTNSAAAQPSEVERAWMLTKDTTSQAILEDFIRQFGGTVYGGMARARLEELKKERATTAGPPVSSAAGKPEAKLGNAEASLEVPGCYALRTTSGNNQKNVALLAANYPKGLDAARAARKVVSANGWKITTDLSISSGNSDYSSYLLAAQIGSADVVIFCGPSSDALVQQGKGLGILQ